MASPPPPAHLRSLYRALLRELPPRPVLASPRSSLHRRIRSSFASSAPGPSDRQAVVVHYAVHAARQAVSYLRSQRLYVALLDRYNPGMDMAQDERVRLTARRVGLDLPLPLKRKGDE